MQVPVEFESTPVSNAMVTKADMYRIAGEVLQAQLLGAKEGDRAIPLDALLEEKIGEGDRAPRTGRVLRSEAAFELRFAQLSLSEVGIINKVTVADFIETVRLHYLHALDRIRLEQPNAEWRLVAARVFNDQLNRMFEISNSGGMPDFAIPSALVEQAQRSKMKLAGPQHQARKVEMRPDYRTVCHLAFADVSQASLEDPFHRRTDIEGPMTRYLTTRNLVQLPPSFRRERAKAKELIEWFSEAQASLGGSVGRESVPRAPAKVTEEQVSAAFALKYQLNQTWEEVASGLGLGVRVIQKAVYAEKRRREAADELTSEPIEPGSPLSLDEEPEDRKVG